MLEGVKCYICGESADTIRNGYSLCMNCVEKCNSMTYSVVIGVFIFLGLFVIFLFKMLSD